jgi:hypothetical protein
VGRTDPLRSPDWDGLTGLLDEVCRQKGLLMRGGKPSYQQLSRACRLNPDILRAWRRHRSRPSRAMLEKVAQCAGQEVGPWLRAGGFDEAG